MGRGRNDGGPFVGVALLELDTPYSRCWAGFLRGFYISIFELSLYHGICMCFTHVWSQGGAQKVGFKSRKVLFRRNSMLFNFVCYAPIQMLLSELHPGNACMELNYSLHLDFFAYVDMISIHHDTPLCYNAHFLLPLLLLHPLLLLLQNNPSNFPRHRPRTQPPRTQRTLPTLPPHR